MTDAANQLREKILSIARNEIGYQESPAGSNKTKFGAWYGLDGCPWCMMFVMWVFHQAGIFQSLPKKTASCSDLKNAAKSAGLWITGNYQPGDILIYNFGHTGILEKTTATGYLVAIEGNTGNTSQNNGGQVMRKSRKPSLCLGAVRVNWDAAANPPVQENTGKPETVKPESVKSIFLAAQDVLDGKYGNGDERRQRLTAAGYHPDEIQSIANALYRGTLRVSVTVSALNVRAGPGTNHKKIDAILYGAIVTINAIREGVGASAWGRVSNLNGWIALDFVRLA